MSVTEGYTQEVRTQGSESSSSYHAKFIRFHYVLEEISGGYNATITFQTRGNGSSCVARNGYSYVTIQGNTTRIDWTSQNELSMPNNTNWIDIISNTVCVPASEAVTLIFSGGNIDISEAGGSSSTAFNLNGTASDTLQLAPVMIWHGKVYGSANSQARQILDFYGSVNNQAQRVTKLYGSANGQTKLIHQGFGHNKYFGKVVYYTDNTYTTTNEVLIQSQAEVNSLKTTGSSTTWTQIVGGVTVGAQNIKEIYLWKDIKSLPTDFLSGCQRIDAVDLSKTNLSAIPSYFMKYCSNFNGTLLLPPTVTAIGSDFLWYCRSYNQPLPDISNVTIGAEFLSWCTSFNQPVQIPSTLTKIPNGFLGSCSSFNQPITLPAQITEIGDRFLQGCDAFNHQFTIPSTVTKIGNSFLYGCDIFNQQITLPPNLISIGDSFLMQSNVFNKALTLPQGLLSIGENFLSQCPAFNQNLSLPSSLTGIGKYFLSDMTAMIGTVNVGSLDASIIDGTETSYDCPLSSRTSTVPAYSTGITIAGANRQAWIDKFPNISSGFLHRKLINAGY